MTTILLALIFFFPTDSVVTAVVQSSDSLFLSGDCLTVFGGSDLLCVDKGSQKVIQIGSDGSVRKSIGGKGWGNYEFDGIADVATSFLFQVYVTDRNNRRIQQFDKNLNFIQSFDEQTLQKLKGRFQPIASSVSRFGDVFIIENDGKRILKMNPRGGIEAEFGSYKEGSNAIIDPRDIAVSESDNVFVLDHNKILVFDIFGNGVRSMSLPASDWRNIQTAGGRLIVTSSSQIRIMSDSGDDAILIPKFSVIGLSSTERLSDVAAIKEALFIMTDTSVHRVTLH